MIANLQPYPEYKESGLPWLGRMPRHWDLKRGKSIFLHRQALGHRPGRTAHSFLRAWRCATPDGDGHDVQGKVLSWLQTLLAG